MRYKKIDTVIVLENGKVYRELKDRCRLIKGTLRNNGYLQLTIKNKTIKVHRLVIEAFKGKSDLTVDHIDGNKLNNSLDNLQYLTREENLIRSWKTGSRDIQRLKQKERLKKPVIWNGILFESGIALSKKLGRCESYVSQKIKRNKPINGFKVEFI